MALTELWLIRHGESTANVAASRAELTGLEQIPIDIRDADVPLSATGREQAEALGSWLDARIGSIQAYWSSPYLRARETLGIALGEHAATANVLVDERLRDRELGVLDLLTRRGVSARYPEEAERRLRQGKYYHRPPGGESWADVALRLRSFLHDLPSGPPQTGLIMAHDAVVMIMLSLLLPLDEPRLMKLADETTVLNASVTHLVRPNGRWRLNAFSDVAHLRRDEAPVTVHPGSPDVRPE